jgi:enamine deaminase RidA (YjgF/YER057c/UK114 family)
MKNMIDRILILPQSVSDFDEQFANCLEQIKRINREKEVHIVQLSFFIRITGNNDFIAHSEQIYSSLKTYFGSIPATSVIAQSPAGGSNVSIELVLLRNKEEGTLVEYKEVNGIHYTIVDSSYCKELYAGGVSARMLDKPFVDQVQNTYSLLKAILDRESFSFADIIRQWNYVEQILSIHDDRGEHIQNYQVLNDIRSAFYSQASFANGYPAATGIGMNAGGLVLEVYAVKSRKGVDIVPLKNPKQVDAYHYSNQVLIGDSVDKQRQKSTPKFERAKYISINGNCSIYVSGTASIQNEKTLGENDCRTQTEITLENIAALISTQNLTNTGIRNCRERFDCSFIRVYIKNASDMDIVSGICNRYFGTIPIHYLIADICRNQLLLEIEGVAEAH